MKGVDVTRGYQRLILFGDQPGHTTSGGVAITNCVVEVVECDPPLAFPVLSLRFFDKPYYGYATVEESQSAGNPLYDADTEIGTELNLGPELALSLIKQINVKWPEYLDLLRRSQTSDEGTGAEETD